MSEHKFQLRAQPTHDNYYVEVSSNWVGQDFDREMVFKSYRKAENRLRELVARWDMRLEDITIRRETFTYYIGVT